MGGISGAVGRKQAQAAVSANAAMVAIAVSGGFLLLIGGLVTAGFLPRQLLALDIVTSVVAFLTYGFDKSAAVAGRWRTPEATLHIIALIGGWPGALIAQKVFRHKSKKTPFLIVFWITVLLSCVGHLVAAWLH